MHRQRCGLGKSSPTNLTLPGLSATPLHHINAIREVIDQYQIGLGAQCPSIMVGGLMLNSVDDSVTVTGDGIGGIPIRGQPGVERHE